MYFYGVMHSDVNSFCGDVVLHRINMKLSNEESNLRQICAEEIFWIFVMKIVFFGVSLKQHLIFLLHTSFSYNHRKKYQMRTKV